MDWRARCHFACGEETQLGCFRDCSKGRSPHGGWLLGMVTVGVDMMLKEFNPEWSFV